MAESLYDAAAARLRAGDPAAARDLFRRAAEAGDRKAAAIYVNLLAAGVGGPRDWPAALRLLAGLAPGSPRAATALALIGRMRIDEEGNPLEATRGETLSRSPAITRFEGLFTPEECGWLIGSARPMLAPSVVVDPKTGAQRPDPLRSADSVGFTAPLENPAVHALNRRMAAASGTVPEQGEPLQVLRYVPGGEYREHLDAIPGFANQRVLTMLVWLSNGFEGGGTGFPAASLVLRGAPGDAILFANLGRDGRPDPAARHAGLPVLAGEKWLASRWIRERPFDYANPR
jgi:prolyl 4-hydroxylase